MNGSPRTETTASQGAGLQIMCLNGWGGKLHEALLAYLGKLRRTFCVFRRSYIALPLKRSG